MGGDDARVLYEYFYRKVQEGYVADRVKDGVFQAMMQVALVNDGPVRPTSSHRGSSRCLLTLEKVTLELSVESKEAKEAKEAKEEKKTKPGQPPA